MIDVMKVKQMKASDNIVGKVKIIDFIQILFQLAHCFRRWYAANISFSNDGKCNHMVICQKHALAVNNMCIYYLVLLQAFVDFLLFDPLPHNDAF